MCNEKMSWEIELPWVSLISKCSISLNKRGNYQILQLSKNLYFLDVEYNALLQKVTSFTKYASVCGDPGRIILDKVGDEVDKITSINGIFTVDLRKEVLKLDINEKKLKYATGLRIELPKYKCYDSDMDHYTFRTEFENWLNHMCSERYGWKF